MWHAVGALHRCRAQTGSAIGIHALRAANQALGYSTYETVVLHPQAGYAVLELNRPKALNALSTKVGGSKGAQRQSRWVPVALTSLSRC